MEDKLLATTIVSLCCTPLVLTIHLVPGIKDKRIAEGKGILRSRTFSCRSRPNERCCRGYTAAGAAAAASCRRFVLNCAPHSPADEQGCYVYSFVIAAISKDVAHLCPYLAIFPHRAVCLIRTCAVRVAD